MRTEHLLAVLLVAGCHHGKVGETGPVGDTGGIVDDDGDTEQVGGDTGEEEVEASLSGTVTVKLYTTDEDGEFQYLSWEDAFGEDPSFPFGSIYVAAYTEDGDTEIYRGDTKIGSPSIEPNPYELTVHMPEEGSVRVYASLDIWADSIIQTWDPIGVYPDEVEIEDGAEVGDVDITILVDYDEWFCGSCTGRYGPYRGGGGSCDTVQLDGPVTLQFAYTSGYGLAMLMDRTGNGPYYWDWFMPTPLPGGGEGSYAMNLCENAGYYKLLGAIDTNHNDLIDPSDTWGAHVDESGEEANPIHVVSTDLSDYEVLIPLETGGIDIVPFVQLTGTVTMDGGKSFDVALPAGSTLYVAALQYRPTADISTTTLAATSYDVETFEWKDLVGQSSVEWRLGVPANAIVYLWAYVDDDGDGVVNESGDWIASGGDSNGRVETGTSSSTYELPLAQAGE